MRAPGSGKCGKSKLQHRRDRKKKATKAKIRRKEDKYGLEAPLYQYSSSIQ
jgi:hypothetical protein